MKVLVTGATGFVGGHLVDALLRRGDTVTALVRSRAKGEALAKRGVTPAPGDLADDAALRAAARGQEVVYHLAGLVAAHSEAEFQTVNADGTARLVAAVAAGAPSARLVLVSSMAAAGPSPAGGKLTGTEPARPVTAYGRSKLAGERAVAEGPLPWTILRPPAVYGPGDLELLRVFKATAFGAVPVFGGGGQELSMVYGPDLAEAIAAAG
ncbi:MAG: NAD(P)-dependent oxidoreductase, partial [Gemmatimonadales bacterium]|nr:NAD(P)-dependent oxidoreductase [Gemmatimonadales bacterium]